MSRNRLEDFGRILVLAEKLSDHELFTFKPWGRPKDAFDCFSRASEKEKEEILTTLAYGIQNVYFELCEIISIAKGVDDLAEGTK